MKAVKVGVREQLEMGSSLQVALAVPPMPQSWAGLCQAGGMRGGGLPTLPGTGSAACGVSLAPCATTQPPHQGHWGRGGSILSTIPLCFLPQHWGCTSHPPAVPADAFPPSQGAFPAVQLERRVPGVSPLSQSQVPSRCPGDNVPTREL